VVAAIALSSEHRMAANTADGIALGATLQATETGWIAASGNDRLEGGQGSDVLVGADGTDTIVYGSEGSNYKMLLTASGQVQLLDRSNGDVDTLSGIETAAFADGTADIAFTQASPAALQALGLLYQTLFDRAGDLGGMAWWAGQYSDVGAAVRGFMAAPEFTARYGSASGAQLVEALFHNTGLQTSEAGGIQFWKGYLDSHTQEELIASWIGNDSVIRAQFGSGGLWLV
jgi:Ca2+-binding RTX toxin-like protein